MHEFFLKIWFEFHREDARAQIVVGGGMATKARIILMLGWLKTKNIVVFC